VSFVFYYKQTEWSDAYLQCHTQIWFSPDMNQCPVQLISTILMVIDIIYSIIILQYFCWMLHYISYSRTKSKRKAKQQDQTWDLFSFLHVWKQSEGTDGGRC